MTHLRQHVSLECHHQATKRLARVLVSESPEDNVLMIVLQRAAYHTNFARHPTANDDTVASNSRP
jgi:hypothetical protein